MKELIITLNQLKSDLKAITHELRDELLKDSEYAVFADDMKASREVMASYTTKLIETTPALGALVKKKVDKKRELKVCKQTIQDRLVVTDRETSEQLSFDFKL